MQSLHHLRGHSVKMKNAVDWEKASGIYLTHCTDSFVVQRGNENKDIKILKCYIQGGIAVTIT